MRVLLAQPHGFCAGVARAIGAAQETLRRYGAPVYLPHQVVHNEVVIKSLEAQGIISVESVAAIPKGAVCVFSAHGSPPEDFALAREKGLTVVDATCPLVAKVHNEAKRYHREGYQVVLIGHRGHQEARGTTGQVPMALVSEHDDPPEGEGPVAVLTQTTLSKDDVAEAVARIRQRYPDAVVRDDICYAVSNRQDAVVEMVRRGAEVVLILGSTTSSNSVRMKEVAEGQGSRAYLLLEPEGLDPEWLEGVSCVGVSSGASTPEHLLEGLVGRLVEECGGQVETVVVADEEHIAFTPPRELRGRREVSPSSPGPVAGERTPGS